MSTAPIAVLRDVRVRYRMSGGLFGGRQFEALSGVSFEIHSGDRVGIVGHNGAGKSTVLKLLANVLAPDAGTIQRNYQHAQLLSLSLGFVPYLSGRENAIMSGLLQGLSRRAVESHLEAVREFSELGAFFDEKLHTYSSGMRSRLGFALALQFSPDLLLIDEVMAVGDSDFQAKSRNALNAKLMSGTTVVIASHSEKIITSMCSKALWIEHGKLRGLGTPAEIYAEYNRVARTPGHGGF